MAHEDGEVSRLRRSWVWLLVGVTAAFPPVVAFAVLLDDVTEPGNFVRQGENLPVYAIDHELRNDDADKRLDGSGDDGVDRFGKAGGQFLAMSRATSAGSG